MMLRWGAAAAIGVALVQVVASQQEPAATRPPAASGPGLARAVGYYDEDLRRVVLVGGAGQPKAGERDQVWSWSGRRWELVTTSGPPSRTNAAAAYDGGRRAGVVAGGATQRANASGWEILGDSWVRARDGWTRLGDIPPRDHQAMTADGRGTVLLFGGIPADRSAAWPADTWTLGREGWTRVATEGPTPRGRTALAYDRAREQIVLFGGVGAPEGPGQQQTFLGDTWAWRDGAWRKLADGGPPGRYAHAMAFDERAGVVLLYSGSAAHKDAPLTDMWQWDGRRWTEIALSGPTPGHRYQPVMVYDRARARSVLYGGLGRSADDTWEWDGRRWQVIGP